MTKTCKWSLLLLALAASTVRAQTSYPMITHTTPVAVQRGTTVDVTVSGQMDFSGVYKVLVEGKGIRAEPIPDAKPKDEDRRRGGGRAGNRAVVLKVAVAPDAEVGVREFRVASNRGVSSVGQIVIVDDPVVIEPPANNNTIQTATPIPVPCVVSGRIEAVEDVDFYKLHADAGQVLTFEVLCARLEDKIHDLQKHADPLLTLYDAQGRELAANDDTYFADPLLTFKVLQTGDYFIQVRDAKYDGDPRWSYALTVTNRPYVSHVYPMAGNPGQTLTVEPVGMDVKTWPTLRVPSATGIHQVRLDLGGVPSNPVGFVVSPLPQVLEQEPNDTPEQATRITIPCGINGRIQKRRDLDHFVFKATRGKAIRFEVKARRFGTVLQSSLDSVLDVLSSKGAVLATNDDAFGKDAALVFTPPADADYVLRIRDLNSKGGPTAVYFIEADWARPEFTLRCDPDKAMIGPGSSTAWYVHVNRTNGFTGPVKIDVEGLPRGVTVNPLTIPASMTQGLLVIAAAPDASRDAANVKITGTAVVKEPDGHEATLTCGATPNEEIYLPGGGRGRFDVNMQTVAVTDPSDILEVEVSPKRVSLSPGQEVKLDVTVKRRPDYKMGVTLDILLEHLGGVDGNPLPPGVTVVGGKSKTLLGTGDKGHIVLRAAANAAPVENVPISVVAYVSINFVVKVGYSSPPIPVTVRNEHAALR